jgi:hypothetical protein
MFLSFRTLSSASVLLLTSMLGCSQAQPQPSKDSVAGTQSISSVATDSQVLLANASASELLAPWTTRGGQQVLGKEQLQVFATLDQFIQSQKYEKAIQVVKGFDPVPKALNDWVKQKAEDGHVMVQYYFARQLIEANPLEAAQWFNIAFIGSKIDSNLCAARDAHNAYLIMSKKNREYAAPIMQKHSEYLGQAMDYAIKWHEEHQHSRPQPHWICYRSVKVFDNDLVVYDKDHWPAVWAAIMDEIRDDRNQQIAAEKKAADAQSASE